MYKNHLKMKNKLTSPNLFSDVCGIIEQGRQQAYAAVNKSMIETYWNIGKRIVEEEQSGKEHAEYGEEIINNLSIQLTHRYGRGFSKRYLAYFRRFYLIFQNITILQSRLQNLTWTHIIKVLRIDDEPAIRWYLEAASKETWSVRTLDRHKSSYYKNNKETSSPLSLKGKNGEEICLKCNNFSTPRF